MFRTNIYSKQQHLYKCSSIPCSKRTKMLLDVLREKVCFPNFWSIKEKQPTSSKRKVVLQRLFWYQPCATNVQRSCHCFSNLWMSGKLFGIIFLNSVTINIGIMFLSSDFETHLNVRQNLGKIWAKSVPGEKYKRMFGYEVFSIPNTFINADLAGPS